LGGVKKSGCAPWPSSVNDTAAVTKKPKVTAAASAVAADVKVRPLPERFALLEPQQVAYMCAAVLNTAAGNILISPQTRDLEREAVYKVVLR
jgi:hypothetical protein